MLQFKLAFRSLLLSYMLLCIVAPIKVMANPKQHQKDLSSHVIDPNEEFSAAAVAAAERNGDSYHAQIATGEHLNTNEDASDHQMMLPDASITDRINEVVRFGPVAVDHRNAGEATPPQEIEPYILKDERMDEVYGAATASSGPTASKTVPNQEGTSATAISYPPVPKITNCKSQGQIALTYSEGPSDVTAKIARELKAADAHATFFINATWLETGQYAMVVQNLYNAGHLIGLTYRVPNDDPAAFTDEELRNDIIKSAELIEKVILVAPKYVRLHYTEVPDTRTENLLTSLGFVIVGYNLDSQDYNKKEVTGPNSIQQMYLDTFKKYKDMYDVKGSFISIQYDLPYTRSLSAAPYVINAIDKEGYTMVRLDGCLNDNAPYKESAAGSEYVADKFSLGQAEYHQGQKAVVIKEVSDPIEENDEDDVADDEDDIHMQSVVYGSEAHSMKLRGFSRIIAFAPLLLLLL